MSKVICGYVNMFDKSVTIFDMDTQTPNETNTLGILDIKELPTSIYNLCTIADTNKVHLYGNRVYLEGLVDMIAHVAKPKSYKFNDLELEIN